MFKTLFRTLLVTFLLSMFIACTNIHKETEVDPEIEEMVTKIRTEVDPEFEYKYEKTKFVPPDGKTLLIMGQTLEGITEYMDSFSDQPIPAGWAAYWGIPSIEGVINTKRNETGSSQNHQLLVDRFPNTVLQSALWMVGKWDVLKMAGSGEYDAVIRKFSAWAKETDRPIYLRIGYEFDGAHNEMEPQAYVKAYQRIVDLIRAEGADNIAFVWHSYAAPTFKGYPLSAWYPGDNYVDWVGISLFGHMYTSELNAEGNAVFNLAREHKKPVMIAESSPVHGIEKGNQAVWDSWFVNFFSLAYRKNVKAISFINENWRRLSIDGISEWKDARLQNNEQIYKAWFKETGKKHYLKQSEDLFKLLGYTK